MCRHTDILLDERPIVLQGFFRCSCGKLHCYAGMWWGQSKCPNCGADLHKEADFG